MQTAACSSCGRAIYWVTSPNGKAMPVTARAVTAYTIEDVAGTGSLQAVKHEAPEPIYISHFVDCPNAAQSLRDVVAVVHTRKVREARRARRKDRA